MADRPARADLIAARERLLVLVAGVRWAGEPPLLWCASVEALRVIEDALGMPHTYPSRRTRRQRGKEAA